MNSRIIPAGAAILGIAALFITCARAAEPKSFIYSKDAGEYGVGTLTLPEKQCGREDAVLVIHGGGWSGGNRPSFEGVAVHFTERLGFASFNIEYRLAGPEENGKTPWPACGDDCIAAAEWMFGPEFAEAAGFSPKKIWICGASAGGHLALWTGLHLPAEKVAGIISISGVADPLPDYAVHHKRYSNLFGGHEPSPEEFESMSIMSLVKPGCPRILLTHETDDTVVPIESARHFYEAYLQAGNDIRFYEYSRSEYEGLTGHCIWIPKSRPHRLIPSLELEIGSFVGSPIEPMRSSKPSGSSEF